MKLKIKVTYEWEEEADETLQYYMDDLNISLEEAKENFENSGPHVESLCKLDYCADNCIDTAYKSEVLMEWKD